MTMRRSRYAALADDVPDLVSPYDAIGDDEQPSSIMGQARGAMANRRRRQYDYGDDAAQILGAGGGGPSGEEIEPASTPTAKPEESRYDQLTGPSGDFASKYGNAEEGGPGLDWVQHAPEASGTGGAQSGDTQDDARSTKPITKDELPRLEERTRSAKWDQVDELDKKIAKETEKQGSVGSYLLGLAGGPSVSAMGQAYIRNLQAQRASKANEAIYEDNRRGSEPVGPARQAPDGKGGWVWIQSTKGGGTHIIGPAPAPEENPRVLTAKVRAEQAAKLAEARQKGDVDLQHHKWFSDPETGERRMDTRSITKEAQGPPSPSGETPTSRYDEPIEYPIPGEAGIREAEIRAAAEQKAAETRANATVKAAGLRKSSGAAAKAEGEPVSSVDATRIETALRNAVKNADPDEDPALAKSLADRKKRQRALEERVLAQHHVRRDAGGGFVYTGGGAQKKKAGSLPPPPEGLLDHPPGK